MFNPENAIEANDLHVDSFKYQSAEEMPSDVYASWEDEHPHAKVFKLDFSTYVEFFHSLQSAFQQLHR